MFIHQFCFAVNKARLTFSLASSKQSLKSEIWRQLLSDYLEGERRLKRRLKREDLNLKSISIAVFYFSPSVWKIVNWIAFLILFCCNTYINWMNNGSKTSAQKTRYILHEITWQLTEFEPAKLLPLVSRHPKSVLKADSWTTGWLRWWSEWWTWTITHLHSTERKAHRTCLSWPCMSIHRRERYSGGWKSLSMTPIRCNIIFYVDCDFCEND